MKRSFPFIKLISQTSIMFILDQKLRQDSFLLGNLELCQVLLMNDSNYPWLILVPQKNNLIEIFDLSFDEQILLLKEINFVVDLLKKEYPYHKFNIANLGNIVSQLHIHVIVRQKNDATFPKPVWGNAPAVPYSGNILNETLKNLQKYFNR